MKSVDSNLYQYMPDRNKLTETAIRNIRLNVREIDALRDVLLAWFDIGNKPARPVMVMEQAVNAMNFIERLRIRIEQDVWSDMLKVAKKERARVRRLAKGK
jgi:hypothetical protein